MTALLLLIVIVCIAAGFGRWLLSLLRVAPEGFLLRFAFSAGIGMGTIAYLVLAVGLLGLLHNPGLGAVLAVAALFGLPGYRLLREDFRNRSETPTQGGPKWVRPLCSAVLVAVGTLVIVNCFVPPSSHEWDALAYHLAAPKVYLQHHQIVYLPTDHHSNFPFLVEMFFTAGLLFEGFALANLFHFAFGALCVAAIIGFGRRLAPGAGLLAAAAFAATPIVIWEAGSAYIELGLAFYVLLSFIAAWEYRESRDARWLAVSGLCMGFALGCKALALIPFFFLGVILLLEQARFRGLRWYLLCAVLAGCPFYLKSWVQTQNPVYPFAYSIFGGRDWSPELASAYSGSQKAFGLHQSRITAEEDLQNVRPDDGAPTLLQRLRNTLYAPFGLLTIPRVYYDYNDPGFLNHLGSLFLALPPLAFLIRRPESRRLTVWMGLLAGLWFLAWALSMQYVRYLIPLLPLTALLGACGVTGAAQRWRWVWFLAALAFLPQLWVVGTRFGAELPAQLARATDPQAREAYLTSGVNSYAAEKWINEHAGPAEGAILYEENRGFYLDRPYLWGNYFHSLYIPYSTFADGHEMADWFLKNHYRYALINLRYSQNANVPGGREAYIEAKNSGSIPGLLLQWYTWDALGGERWRGLMGDALKTGAGVVVYVDARGGTAVVEFRKIGGRGAAP